MSNEQLNAQEQINSQKMSNEINTIVNQEIGKEKELVVNADAVHVMPQKFLPSSPKKQLSGKQKIILGSIAFVIFLLIVVGSMLAFANFSVSKQKEKNDQNTSQEQNVNPSPQNNTNPEPVELTGDAKINADLNILVEALTKYKAERNIFPDKLSLLLGSYVEKLPRQTSGDLYDFSSKDNGENFIIVVEFSGENPNIKGKYQMTKDGLGVYMPSAEENNAENTNNNGNTTPPPPPPPTSNNLDQDKDELSTEEELLFATDSNDADTDNDGYKDGVEIINLYNPLLSNQALKHSSLVKQFSNQTVKYLLLIPKNWLAETVDNNDLETTFTPDSSTGDFMNLNAEIANQQSLQQWAQSQAGGNNLSSFTLGKESKISALQMKTSDEHIIFAKVNNYFIKFTYHIDSASNPFFNSTFLMMLNSFSLLN